METHLRHPFRCALVALATATLLVPRVHAAPGDLYVTTDAATVDRITPAGVQTTYIAKNAGSGLTEPEGLAFDTSGNLYVADYNTHNIYKYTSGTSQTTFGTVGSGAPYGLAFDKFGNLYVATGGGVYKIPPAGGTSTLYYATSVSATDLAFDTSGNLYVALGNSTIVKVTAANTGTVFASTDLNLPVGLAFDASGNLYAANSGSTGTNSNSIAKFTTSGVASIFATGLSDPDGLAIDSSGNVYVANDGSNVHIVKFNPTGTSSVTFDDETNGPELIAFQPSPVPEPGTWALLLLGGMASLLVVYRSPSRRALA